MRFSYRDLRYFLSFIAALFILAAYLETDAVGWSARISFLILTAFSFAGAALSTRDWQKKWERNRASEPVTGSETEEVIVFSTPRPKLGAEGRALALPVALFVVSAWAYFPEVGVWRGDRSFNVNQFQTAIEQYSKAIPSDRLPPRRLVHALEYRALARTNFALDYVYSGESWSIADRFLIGAAKDYELARSLAPNNTDLMYQHGIVLQYLGAYVEAADIFIELGEMNEPKFYWSIIRLAAVRLASEDYEDALSTLEEILEIWGEPRGMPYNHYKGRILLKMGRFEEAIDTFSVGMEYQEDWQWA